MKGILGCRGKFCLMVDADGATKFSDLDKLMKELDRIQTDNQGIAIGSRSHLVPTEAVVKVSVFCVYMCITLTPCLLEITN